MIGLKLCLPLLIMTVCSGWANATSGTLFEAKSSLFEQNTNPQQSALAAQENSQTGALVSVLSLLLGQETQGSGERFAIIKSTIDAGGGVSTGGDFRITGSIGQADATNRPSSGGQFRLAGGFWADL